MGEHLLGIDIGTTSTKAVLCDLKGGVLAEASAPAVLHSPRPGWAEADPEEWWANVCRVAPRCLEAAGAAASSIAAVGVSGMVPTVVLLDRDERVLRPSIQQNDARSHHEIAELKTRVDETQVLHRTGNPVTQQSIGPKLQWLRRHEPAVMERAVKVVGSYDSIVNRLTGTPSIERNWPLESGLWDLHREEWDGELLALASLERELLPAGAPAGGGSGPDHPGGSGRHGPDGGDAGGGGQRRPRRLRLLRWAQRLWRPPRQARWSGGYPLLPGPARRRLAALSRLPRYPR